MDIFKLIDEGKGTMIGEPYTLDKNLWKGGGSLPILLTGLGGGTVTLEATIATQQEIEENTAVWATVSQASWTANTADGLFTPFTHIRGRVLAYSSGTITMTTFV